MKKDSNMLRMNLQFFAEDGAGEPAPIDATGLDTMLDGMGTDTGVPATEVTPEPEPEPQPEPEPEPGQPTAIQKQEFAFAEMRRTNAQYAALLGKIAQVNGIEYQNTNDLLSKLNDNTITAMAKQQNVPVELLQRIESLQQDSDAFKAQQAQQSAVAGFQKVMTTHGLTEAELQSFARELDAKGVNPFVQQVDIEAEYKLTHFDDIVAKQIDRAVKEALAKSNSADNNSTTPMQQQSPGGTDNKPVSTLDGLNAMLDQMGR